MGQRTALVIGSEGFIGSRTARRLADLDWNVTRSAKEQLDLHSPPLPVYLSDRTLFTSWLDSWAQQQRVSAATDLTISPVYVGDVTNSLLTLIESGSVGVRLLAGPKSASVYGFAVEMA